MLDPCADGAKVAFVSKEEGTFGTFAPEANRVRERADGSLVAADEAPSKVDAVEVVLFGIHVCNLSDVV